MIVTPSLRASVLALALAACVFCLAIHPPTASAAPDPLGDADGDGLPYQWETPPPAAIPQPAAATSPKRCNSKQRLRKGHCVPRCRKGQKLKRGKCVKRKKRKNRHAKGRGARATAQALAAPTNVAAFGANPDHKDVFVQIDYASAALRQNVACAELDAIVAAFAGAPVSNPDGRTGIDLHIDAGIACPSRSYDLGGSRVFDAGSCPSSSATFQAAELPENRIGTFHIAAFAPTCGQGGSASGLATQPGVKMAVFTDGFSFAHVLMHELGHNLGLDHPFPGQPNRISSMNTLLSVSDSGNGSTQILDYQRIELPALDEKNLSEAAGISAPAEAHRFYVQHHCENTAPASFRNAWPGDGPIDWNCSEPAIKLPPFTFTPDPGTFARDVNGDGQKTVFPATGNEWVTLDYASGGKIGL